MVADGEALDATALAMARGGMGRVEIAAGLGLAVEELGALEAERPGFALAMRRADTLAQAWWEALPREAMAAGARFDLSGWLEAMRRRWGQTADRNLRRFTVDLTGNAKDTNGARSPSW